LGVTGLDIVEEYRNEESAIQIVFSNLKYGKASLVVAVPESWLHISSVYDLADLSAKWRLAENPRHLRIATKFTKLTERFLHNNNIFNYQLIDASGVIELAPRLKVADVIIDLTSTGTTLRENQLKVIDGGLILDSQACLIANPAVFREKRPDTQEPLEQIIDLIESKIRARNFLRVMTNINCDDPDQAEEDIVNSLEQHGVKVETHTLSRSVSNSGDGKHVVNVNLVVPFNHLYKTVRTLRRYNALEIASSRIDYLFLSESSFYQKALSEAENNS
ncbi:MAG: ATP phosphoribosyltransferase, partial [Spirochaetota bacterium]|nr:ATP phosphoribosyltransferase [Spirochaetota bacterium]